MKKNKNVSTENVAEGVNSATDLLRRRVKLGAQMDVLISQLSEVHQELSQLHSELGRAIFSADPKFADADLPNVLVNFREIMEKRLHKVMNPQSSIPGGSLEEAFAQENTSILARLEAPKRPKETFGESIKRIGLVVHKMEGAS